MSDDLVFGYDLRDYLFGLQRQRYVQLHEHFLLTSNEALEELGLKRAACNAIVAEARKRGYVQCPLSDHVRIDLREPISIDFGKPPACEGGNPYGIPVNELRGPELAKWIAHLMEKSFMGDEEWSAFMWCLRWYVEIMYAGFGYALTQPRSAPKKAAA